MSGLLYFCLGSVLTFILSPWFRDLLEKWRLRPSWAAFYRCLTDKRVLELLMTNRPDIIIGLNNGIVPAGIIATNLGIEDIYYFHAYPAFDSKGCRKDPLFHELSANLAGKRILIVDDQIYTGKTMDAAYRFILRQPGVEPDRVARFALFRSAFAPKLEYPSLEILHGAIRQQPWSFSKDHASWTLWHGTASS